MTIDMSQFYDVFFEEAAELLEEMELLLLQLDVDAPSKDDLNAIFRTAHSIKGGAGTFGFNEITATTHILESLLDELRNDALRLRSEMVDVFLKAVDVLKMQLAGRQSGSEVDAQAVAEICKRLNELAVAKQDAAPAAAAAPVAAAPAVDTAKQAPPAASVASDAAAPVDPSPENLYAILTSEPITQAPAANAPAEDSYGFFTDPAPQAATAENPGRRATDAATDAPAQIGRRAGDRGEAAEASSIRVGVEKVDQLINLVGELVITQAMLAQSASRVDPVLYESLLNGLATLERNTRNLQESVISIRMMPISFVFSRFPRVARDLAAKLGKQVELKTVGEGTELDKGLIEKIADPLNHLVRNSLDHGIETPDKRIAAGKDPKGTITLRAFHQGGNIIIEVADDGAGLSRERILAKARERGMAVSDAMPDAEVWQLIFEAGFSTAAVVTDVSGRGVGMDVVRRNIQALGGRVEIDSTLGRGTRIAVRLPLTLAILDGLSVLVGGELFIVPLTYIVESLQPRAEDVKTISGRGRVVQVRGEYVPVVALHEVFNIKPEVSAVHKGILVILEAEGRKTALFVDALVGQHQVVIKSLESNYRRVQGISGATIMGDGRVALILDAVAIADMAQPSMAEAA